MGPIHSNFWVASGLAIVALFCAGNIRFTDADIIDPNYHPWSPEGGGNCKGSSQCHSIKKGYCEEAVSFYDNNTVYYKYTSRTSRGNNVLGQGCAAMYKCVSDSDFGSGMTGKELKEAFAIIYSKAPHGGACGICGSHTVENPKCWVTLNMCRGCVDTNGGAGVPLSVVCPPLNRAQTAFLPWNSGNGSGSTHVATDLWGANPSGLAVKTAPVTQEVAGPTASSSTPSNAIGIFSSSSTPTVAAAAIMPSTNIPGYSSLTAIPTSAGGVVGNGPIVPASAA